MLACRRRHAKHIPRTRRNGITVNRIVEYHDAVWPNHGFVRGVRNPSCKLIGHCPPDGERLARSGVPVVNHDSADIREFDYLPEGVH